MHMYIYLHINEIKINVPRKNEMYVHAYFCDASSVKTVNQYRQPNLIHKYVCILKYALPFFKEMQIIY